MKRMRRLPVLLGCVLLGSCLGGGGGGDASGGITQGACESITGGGAKVTMNGGSGCFGCSVTDEQKAADGDLTTAASITAPTSFSTQGPTIRATAQPGIVFAGGQQASVFFTSPASSGANPPDHSVTLTTYLSGSKQEDATTYTTVLSYNTGGQTYSFKGFTTNKPFDAVEVMVSDTEGATGAWEIHEICSNSNVQ